MNQEKKNLRGVNSITNKPDFIRLKAINERYRKTRRNLLIWIIALILILASIIAYAAWRAGGVQNLISGNGNIVTNTLNNVGSIVTNPTQTATPTPTIFTVSVTQIPRDEKTLSQSQNTLIITKYGRYNVKIRKDTYIFFVNDTGKSLGLEFSDGRQYRFEDKEKKNILFSQVGAVTFRDVIDSRLNPIDGTITVIN